MDKCTTEQFWATGAVTGLNAFMILQYDRLALITAGWVLAIVAGFVALYGSLYVIHRHISYYDLRAALVDILRAEPHTPEFLKTYPSKWTGRSLIGAAFYVAWIAIIAIGVIITYLR